MGPAEYRDSKWSYAPPISKRHQQGVQRGDEPSCGKNATFTRKKRGHAVQAKHKREDTNTHL